LSLVVSNYLFNRFENLPEGDLTKLRASTVSEGSLAKIAKELNLGDYLRLGKGEENTGGRERNSILADAMEAVIGAIYLDGGFENASDFVLRYLTPEIDKSLEGKGFRDYKTELQEVIQKGSEQEIHYCIILETGPDHDKEFVAQVSHNGKVIGEGTGKSKKEAEQQAARQALEKIHNSTL
jgi:RNAse III (EC 3.1.26.3)